MKMVEHISQGQECFLEMGAFIDYDLGDDDSVTINGVWLQSAGRDDIEITAYLSTTELEQARGNVRWMLEKEADRREALAEDAADSRAQAAIEEQKQ